MCRRFKWMLSLLFSFWQQKEKGNKKERLPSALFELFQSGIPLKEKNSLRSNSFSFFTLHTSPSISRSKSEAGHSWRNIASLVRVDEHTQQNKSTQKTSEAKFTPPTHLKLFRHLVEEREENSLHFREEQKAVWA